LGKFTVEDKELELLISGLPDIDIEDCGHNPHGWLKKFGLFWLILA
jgi:hypothetical protein